MCTTNSLFTLGSRSAPIGIPPVCWLSLSYERLTLRRRGGPELVAIDGQASSSSSRGAQPIGEARHITQRDALGLAIAVGHADLQQALSSTSRVSRSIIGGMPASSSAVATQIALEPGIGGVSQAP